MPKQEKRLLALDVTHSREQQLVINTLLGIILTLPARTSVRTTRISVKTWRAEGIRADLNTDYTFETAFLHRSWGKDTNELRRSLEQGSQTTPADYAGRRMQH